MIGVVWGCLGCWRLRVFASTCVDLSVVQFTSRVWGVGAVVPSGVLSLAGVRVWTEMAVWLGMAA